MLYFSAMSPIVLKPPTPLVVAPDAVTVFLSGSIEQGAAVDWQKEVTDAFQDLDIVILNPRRDKWEPNVVQDISDPIFKGQVDWELDALDRADVILMHLVPGTMSPISLLELGLHVPNPNLPHVEKLVVSCPDGFWRRGNVQVVCDRYGVALHDNLTDAIAQAKDMLTVALEDEAAGGGLGGREDQAIGKTRI